MGNWNQGPNPAWLGGQIAVPLTPVACPHCGKVARLPVMAHAQTVTCSVCEQQFVARPTAVAAPPQIEPSSPPPPAPVQAVEGPRQHSSRAWIGIACAGVLLALAVLAGVILWPGDSWEQKNQARLLAMKSDAQKLALSGNLQEAYEKYQELLRAVGERKIESPGLRREIEQATEQQREIFRQLTARAATAPVQPPITPPVSPPVQPETPPVAPVSRPTVPPVAVDPGPVAPPVHPPPAQPPVTPEVAKPWPNRRVDFAIRPQPSGNPDEVTDEQIGRAIQRGIDLLVAQFDPNTFEMGQGNRRNFSEGLYALTVYTLLQAGQATGDKRLDVHDDFMKGLLTKLKTLPMQDNYAIYERGLRATALAVYDRPEDREVLKADVASLIESSNGGTYTYSVRLPGRVAPGRVTPRPARPGVIGAGDPSNSQYGLLGVWSGAEVAMEVSAHYWEEVQTYWEAIQCNNGQWAYMNAKVDKGSFSMTCAGIASLFVTHDYLDAVKFGTVVGRDPFPPALAKALGWLEEGDNSVNVTDGAWYDGYNLYGLERVGLASGFKYFGKHDWYRELARLVVASQRQDGSWGRLLRGRMGGGGVNWQVRPAGMGGPDGIGMAGAGAVRPADDITLIETSYALLFLSRGRHPILLNKLRFDGFWANRPRDAANLARYASHQLERPLNWQVVSFGKDYSDWMDCPVLYLASHQPLKLDEEQIDQLRQYVYAGGMLFTQSDGGSEAFNKYVAELSQKLFPAYELRDLPATHELYSLVYPVDPKPPLKAVSNGTRILLLHSPTDISMHWQQRAEKSKKNVFDLGVNLFLYASGKSDLRNRLTSPYLPAPIQPATEKLKLARVRYGGNWDPEPGAYIRFTRYLQRQTSLGLQYETVLMKDLPTCGIPMAHLTGTAAYTPSDSEIAAIKQYVEAGGVLVIDSAGGETPFADSVRTSFLPRAFGGANITDMPADHPVFAGGGGLDAVAPVPQLRHTTGQKFGRSAGRCQSFQAGKGYVIVCPLDFTVGLLGTNMWGISGYRPDYAQAFLRNVVVWGNGTAAH